MKDGAVTRGFRPVDLSQRLASGDRTVLADCVDTYGDFVWGLAKRFTDTESDAEDLTVEIFDKLWPSAAAASPKPEVEMAFIFGVVRTVVMERRTDAP